MELHGSKVKLACVLFGSAGQVQNEAIEVSLPPLFERFVVVYEFLGFHRWLPRRWGKGRKYTGVRLLILGLSRLGAYFNSISTNSIVSAPAFLSARVKPFS